MSSHFMAVSADECATRRSAAAVFLERDVLRAVPDDPAPELGELVIAFVDRGEVVAGQLAGLAGEHGRAVRKKDLGLAYPAGVQKKVARSGVARLVLVAEVKVEVAKGHPCRLATPPCLEELGFQWQQGAEPGAGLRRFFSLQAGEEPKVGDFDHDHAS